MKTLLNHSLVGCFFHESLAPFHCKPMSMGRRACIPVLKSTELYDNSLKSHALADSPIHAYIHSRIHSTMHSCMHSYIHFIHFSIRSLIHSFVHSCIQPSIRSFMYVFTHSCKRPLTHVYVYPCIHSLTLCVTPKGALRLAKCKASATPGGP